MWLWVESLDIFSARWQPKQFWFVVDLSVYMQVAQFYFNDLVILLSVTVNNSVHLPIERMERARNCYLLLWPIIKDNWTANEQSLLKILLLEFKKVIFDISSLLLWIARIKILFKKSTGIQRNTCPKFLKISRRFWEKIEYFLLSHAFLLPSILLLKSKMWKNKVYSILVQKVPFQNC